MFTRGWLLQGRRWTSRLYRDPHFRTAMAVRWRQLVGGGLVRRTLAAIERDAAAIASAQAKPAPLAGARLHADRSLGIRGRAGSRPPR